MSEKQAHSGVTETKLLGALESTLDYRFSRIELLEQALTHSSLANESTGENDRDGSASANAPNRIFDNEQLEFLGDSVIAFVTSRALFQRYPGYSEGQLSKTRAHLVSARHLLHAANELNLGAFLRLGKGEDRSGGRHKSTLLVDALEAVVAALYLDGGLEPARNFILKRVINPELERMEGDPENALAMSDQKSALQEWLQSVGGPPPVYKVVHEEGPDHDRIFTVELRIGNSIAEAGATVKYVNSAQGRTKKKAEQNAAQEALYVLRNQNPSIQ